MIPLFDVSDKKIVPSSHCYNIPWMKEIMDLFPNEYIQIYSYAFYTTCPDSTMNPYWNIPEDTRESVILADLKPTFYLDDMRIEAFVNRCKEMYHRSYLWRSFR